MQFKFIMHIAKVNFNFVNFYGYSPLALDGLGDRGASANLLRMPDGSAAADECDDLQAIAFVENALTVDGGWHDLKIAFDGDGSGLHIKIRKQLLHSDVSRHFAFVAIYNNAHSLRLLHSSHRFVWWSL